MRTKKIEAARLVATRLFEAERALDLAASSIAELNAAIAVCERVSGERAELLKAVERLSKRLKLSTNELSRLTRGLK